MKLFVEQQEMDIGEEILWIQKQGGQIERISLKQPITKCKIDSSWQLREVMFRDLKGSEGRGLKSPYKKF